MIRHRLTPAIKWHGGKQPLARRIVERMPAHRHYVEPFAGGLAVLFAKNPEGVSEVVNDLNGDLTNFWRVLQQPDAFQQFRRMVEAIPFSQVEWQDSGARQHQDDPIRRAVDFFIRCRQSLAGRMDSFAPLSRRRTRRGMNEQASAWLTAVDGLADVHQRLRRVVILNRPALEVIRQEDGSDTLFYCDPPYLPITRSASAVYEHEMTEADHRELLDAIASAKGRVMLSGYPSSLYEEHLRGWTKYEFDRPNNAASGKSKAREMEMLWCNF